MQELQKELQNLLGANSKHWIRSKLMDGWMDINLRKLTTLSLINVNFAPAEWSSHWFN